MESLHRGAPLPLNESLRLKTLQRHKVLDTESEQAFDRITQLAQKLLKAPIVLISLVDAHRQWFKSCIGLAEMLGVKEVKETPRDQAFCAHAILSDKLLVIPDATQDHRFMHNPLVTGPPYIRFYAGSPLETSDGYRLGTLCVIDVVPRRLTPEEESVLRDLSKMVIREMEGRNLTRSMMRVANLGELALECPNLDSIINEAMRMLLEELNLERAELLYPLRPCSLCLPCQRCKDSHVFKLSRTRGGGRMNEGEIFSDCHAHAVCESSQTIVLADHQTTAQSTPNYQKLTGEHAEMHTRNHASSPAVGRRESQGEHHFASPNMNRRKSRNETLMMLASQSSGDLPEVMDSLNDVSTPVESVEAPLDGANVDPLASISVYLKPTRAPHCLLRVLGYQCQERDFEPSEVAFFNSVAHILTVCMDREFTDKKIMEEKVKVTELLLNILPQDIVTELQKSDIKANTNKIISAKYDEATVLFADLVGFTELSSRLPAVTVVTILNDIFSVFDQLAEEHRMEKIKTIGDAYMAASGVPVAVHPFQQAMNAANMALDVIAKVDEIRIKYEEKLDVRVGIHTGGPVVAGVIGLKKFCYDLWGDCVNLASRMESTGQPGKVHCTKRLKDLLENHFVFEPRGPQAIKGKGMLETFFLVKRLEGSMSDSS